MADESDQEVQAGPAASAAAGPGLDTSDFHEFILTRELSEVFLLIDNLAADADTTISSLSKQNPPDGLGHDWIEGICQIKWPSQSTTNATEAAQAALVIKAKDYLNGLAKPASGSTIAFTLLFTQHRKRGLVASPEREEHFHTARRMLAAEAYPEYIVEAASFRKTLSWINRLLIAWLVLTCFLSWYVAYGNAALGEYATFKTNFEKAQSRVDDDEAGRRQAAAAAAGSTLTPPQPVALPPETIGARAAAADKTEPEIPYCDRWMLVTPAKRPAMAPAGWSPRYETPEQRQACRERDTAAAQLKLGEERLYKWLGIWRGVLHVTPKEGDASSIASRLTTVMGTAALPVLYGLLGAGAAVLRALSRKIRLSTLSPRDLSLSLQQLALGAVIGACIGLFIAQPGKDSPLIGPVALSGSAISFIAGFGVEAVFQALEGLISRIFNVPAVGAHTRTDSRPGS